MTPDDPDFHVSQALTTDDFILRPIRVSDAERDYEALMESREYLRIWEQSTWPEDDFTLEANRADLEDLERRHVEGDRFTYTVMDPGETTCLGCVYIVPTGASLFSNAEISPSTVAQWSEFDVAIYFWARKSCLADGLDRKMLEALGPWLKQEWHIRRFLVVTPEKFEQQVALFKSSGFRLTFRFKKANEPGFALAFAPASSGA